MTNFGSGYVNINRGDKIAQIMFVKLVPFLKKFLNFLIPLSEELVDMVLQEDSFLLFSAKKKKKMPVTI